MRFHKYQENHSPQRAQRKNGEFSKGAADVGTVRCGVAVFFDVAPLTLRESLRHKEFSSSMLLRHG